MSKNVHQKDLDRKIEFTLIELLIVIAIIAILTGLLLPALKSARDKGKGILCTSRLKQQGIGFEQYLSDNEYYYMYADVSWDRGDGVQTRLYWSGPRSHCGSFNYTLNNLYSYCNDEKVRRWCPNVEDRYMDISNTAQPIGCSFRTYGCFRINPLIARTKASQHKHPSKTLLVMDGADSASFVTWGYTANQFTAYTETQLYYWLRHSGMSINVLHLDGHVKNYGWRIIP